VATACYRPAAGGILVTVRLTPGAHSNIIEGVDTLADGRAMLRVRVRAVPEGGAATSALQVVLAKAFGRPKSAVALISGAKQRVKVVMIGGEIGSLTATAERWPVVAR
jgi:uncharacterized protein YggU (UPF0235/DUF167 family)